MLTAVSVYPCLTITDKIVSKRARYRAVDAREIGSDNQSIGRSITFFAWRNEYSFHSSRNSKSRKLECTYGWPINSTTTQFKIITNISVVSLPARLFEGHHNFVHLFTARRDLLGRSFLTRTLQNITYYPFLIATAVTDLDQYTPCSNK